MNRNPYTMTCQITNSLEPVLSAANTPTASILREFLLRGLFQGQGIPSQVEFPHSRGVFSRCFSKKMRFSSTIPGCHSRTWLLWVTNLGTSVTSAASSPCSTLQGVIQPFPSRCKFHNKDCFCSRNCVQMESALIELL